VASDRARGPSLPLRGVVRVLLVLKWHTGQGRPLPVVVALRQRHESTPLEGVLDAARVPRIGDQFFNGPVLSHTGLEPEHLVEPVALVQFGRCWTRALEANVTTANGKPLISISGL
jgi:hypothetical protein